MTTKEPIVSIGVAMDTIYKAIDEHLTYRKEETERQGQPIHCHQGCAACCAMLVDCSAIEAAYIADYIEQLPNKRRRALITRLVDWNIVWRAFYRTQAPRLGLEQGPNTNPLEMNAAASKALVSRWQVLRRACPFLDLSTMSCGIYARRPVMCRMLMVMDPPDDADPEEGDGRPPRQAGIGCETTEEDASTGVLPPLWVLGTTDLVQEIAPAMLDLSKKIGAVEHDEAGFLPVMVLGYGVAKYGWPTPERMTAHLAIVPEIPSVL